jgi:alpha-glucosidase
MRFSISLSVLALCFVLSLAALSGCQSTSHSFGLQSDWLGDDHIIDEPQGADLSVAASMARDVRTPIGPFTVAWQGVSPKQGKIVITHKSRGQEPLWATVPGRTFIEAGLGAAEVHERRGSFLITDHRSLTCSHQVVDEWESSHGEVQISGSFSDKGCDLKWTLRFSMQDSERLTFTARVRGVPDRTKGRLFLRYASRPAEHFYGFGMQFTELDMKGRLLPILTQEQGVGRGLSPLSTAVNVVAGRGVAGDWWTSYGTVPHYISSDIKSVYLENTEMAAFDLRHPSEVRIAMMSDNLVGIVIVGNSFEKLVEVYTRYAGRMEPLPTWVDQGAIVGVQGGTGRVREIYRALKASGVAISALWIQDWVGRRKTSFGSQLWWNWELDQEAYPGWSELVADLARDQVRVLTYLNPFLVDVRDKSNARRSLFKEAEKSGYLVKKSDGTPYLIQNTSFSAGLLDISSPEARQWMKGVIKDQVLKVGASGWMADFGEALPFDGVMQSGSPWAGHNAYPENWAQLNKQTLQESGQWSDALIFSRSAFTQSPGKTRLFWLGDQLVTWDHQDGMKTALIGLLSSGLSGFSQNHSDTGGYTTIDNVLLKYHRSPELLKRWTELNAFTPVLRTHEGNIPEVNAQVYDTAESRAHFAKFSQVYRVLASYRRELSMAAAKTGMPLVRPLFLQYPSDPMVYSKKNQFLFGPRLMVAPVFEPKAGVVEVYVPEDGWVHLRSGRVLPKGLHRIEAPMGHPAVFYHGRGQPDPAWLAPLRTMLSRSY